MTSLEGKVALVTGVGRKRGIGRGIATRLAAEGADLVVSDITNQETDEWGGMPEVVREIEAMGRRAIGILADISNSQHVSDMVSQALDEFGRIDILVNNAGAPIGRDRVPVVDLEESEWDLVYGCNAKGTFLCCKTTARHMLERGGGGRIINIASVAGKRGLPRFAAYCASKFAVVGLTEALAKELAPHGITVNAVCPGTVDTERIGDIAAATAPEGVPAEQARKEYSLRLGAGIPVGKAAQASDVANVVAFLASETANHITGASIPVTGGSDTW